MSSSPLPRETSTAQIFTIQLSNTLSELVTLNHWLENIVQSSNISKELSFKLNLVLEETVTNVIQHGFARDQDGCIEIRLGLNNQNVTLEIQDDGISFNPLDDHTVVLPETLQDAAIGGLGIHLIKNYVDDITYQRRDERNILNLSLSTNACNA